jgi:flagellar basal-body rod modification protein FlgD
MIEVSEISANNEGKNLNVKEPLKIMKEDFLKLLVAQLCHQDPLNPMEAIEFTSQLSQLAQLEQIFNIKESLNYLNLYQASINNIEASNLIGRNVKARGNVITLQQGNAVPLNYTLENDAISVRITIADQRGRVVRVYNQGAQNKGIHTIHWDGLDGAGIPLPSGEYTFSIDARGKDGRKLDTYTFINGKVTALEFENSRPFLLIDNTRISMGDVIEISH